MKKFTTAVAVTILGATIAFAAPHGYGRGEGHGKRGGFGEKFAQELGLTDAQKEQIKAIKRASREENKAFFEQARATREQFHAAKKANDTATMESLKATAESQRAQMKQIRDAEKAKIASVLTPDQNAKWQALRAQRQAERGEHRHNRQ